MKRISIFVLCLSLLAAACTQKTSAPGAGASPNATASSAGPRDALIGTWWSSLPNGQSISMTFNKDGSYSVLQGGQTTSGTFDWVDDSTIATHVNGSTNNLKVAVAGDQLSLTVGSETSTFHRQATGADAKTLIVGNWKMNGSDITAQFGADGSYSTDAMGIKASGTYKWLDDSTIELDLAGGKASTMKIALTQDQLTETSGSDVFTFSRATAAGAQLSPTPAPAESVATGPASVTQLTLASQVSPLTRTPITTSQQFPTTGIIDAVVAIANAPPNTRVRTVLSTADGTKKVGDEQTTTQGSQNVVFYWTYSNMQAGDYKVDAYLNDALARTADLKVSKDATPAPAPPTPGSVGSCPAVNPSGRPPSFQMNLMLATGVDGKGNPVSPARIFKPTSTTLYAVIQAGTVPAGTKFNIRWIAHDLGGLEGCDAQFGTNELTLTSAGTNPYFTATAPQPTSRWPEGLYRVELLTNGELTVAEGFAVCADLCSKFSVPADWQER